MIGSQRAEQVWQRTSGYCRDTSPRQPHSSPMEHSFINGGYAYNLVTQTRRFSRAIAWMQYDFLSRRHNPTVNFVLRGTRLSS
jgi:hypothetical protein